MEQILLKHRVEARSTLRSCVGEAMSQTKENKGPTGDSRFPPRSRDSCKLIRSGNWTWWMATMPSVGAPLMVRSTEKPPARALISISLV